LEVTASLKFVERMEKWLLSIPGMFLQLAYMSVTLVEDVVSAIMIVIKICVLNIFC